MKKTLLSAIFLVALAGAAHAETAVQKALSEMPDPGQPPASGAATSPLTIYLPGARPINMNPGAYVNHDNNANIVQTANTTDAGRLSYPLPEQPKSTSAAAYNKQVKAVRLDQLRAQNGGSLIPSPFPEGF